VADDYYKQSNDNIAPAAAPTPTTTSNDHNNYNDSATTHDETRHDSPAQDVIKI
jgi:hypothetical protein